jgi:protein gp37
MGDTNIEWTDKTWNPLRGCTPVSEGCRNCYAAGVAARFSGPGQSYEGLAQMTERGPRWTGEIREVTDHLQDPLHWRKPSRVFVNSMSDLFHPAVSDEFIAKVFGVMAAASRHTFQVLTKRPQRMADLLADPAFAQRVGEEFAWGVRAWPLPNVWLGTSVEDQAAAEARIPHLLRTPAAVRFLSCEPLLGPIDLVGCGCEGGDGYTNAHTEPDCWRHGRGPCVDWVIAGGESGHGARPMDLAWARSLRDQCNEAGVAFFFKQTGTLAARTSSKGGSDDDIPPDLRIRQYPATTTSEVARATRQQAPAPAEPEETAGRKVA